MAESTATYLGLGYIGLPTAILTAKSGIKTLGYDIDSQKIDSIVEGNLFTKEPGLKDELKSVLESGSLSISTSLEIANTYVVVVPTPLISQNLPDISIGLMQQKIDHHSEAWPYMVGKTASFIAVLQFANPPVASGVGGGTGRFHSCFSSQNLP